MIGQAGARTYEIPLRQMVQPGGSVPGVESIGGDLGLPDEPKGLAIRRQLTSDLYNKYGMLKRYAEDMAKKGINVWEPDYSQDNGGPEFETFMNLDANVRYATQALQNELEAEKQLRPYLWQNKAGYAQGVDPQSAMISQDPNAVVSYEPMPFVDQANKFSGQNTYTQGDENAFNLAYFQRAEAKIDQMVAAGQMSPQEAQIQKANLQRNVHQTAYQQLIDRTGRGAKNTPEIEVLKKVTNLIQGVWPEGTYSVKTRGGKALLENKTYAGEYLGEYIGEDSKGNQKKYQKIVKRWLKDPDTGTITVEFENPEVPSEVVSSTKGDVIAAAIIANNPKFGSAQKMYATARELGFLDDTSSARNEFLIPQNAKEIQEQSNQFGKAQAQITSQKYNTAKSQLERLENPLLGHNTVVFTLPDGGVLKIGKHKGKGGKKFFIDNAEELGITSKKEDLTLDEAMEYLDSANYFDQFLGQTPKQALAPEKQKAQDLINKYRN